MMKTANEVGPTAHAELLDVRQVAKLLKCSTRTVWRLADGGRMPAPIKVAALRRWRLAELLDWIEADCPAARPKRVRR